MHWQSPLPRRRGQREPAAWRRSLRVNGEKVYACDSSFLRDLGLLTISAPRGLGICESRAATRT
jgi:hypothetical protein